MKYITRIAGGWWVRVKVIESKLFSDNKYGGEKNALKEAIKWRSKAAKKNKVSLGGRVERPIKGGVARCSHYKKQTGVTYYSYTAHIWDRAKQKQIKKEFSVTANGETVAKRLAENHLEVMRADLAKSNKQPIEVN